MKFKKIGLLLATLLLTLFTVLGCKSNNTQPSTSKEPASSTSATQAATQKQTQEQTEQKTEKPTQKPTEKQTEKQTQKQTETQASAIDINGSYTTKEDVALYLHTYNKLPKNFITKSQANKLGWQGGSLEKYAPGKCIGGDRFGNYEQLLPSGKTYYECDIDTLGAKSRGAKRIVFTKDGDIYYTDDHYETFEKLY